ncbi:MAG TPA: branched-chain amino acid aminotransferase [Bacillales bacterium]|nr:branched-chain amino acid aminotransferase [Bacillales bacterium]
MNSILNFDDAHIERIDKETEEVLAKETIEFLKEPIDYFKKHKNEFLYVESKSFDKVRTDAVSFEVDDAFGTYDVMLGLKLQKKHASKIKEQLGKQLETEEAQFDLIFNGEDGLWDLNFTFNHVTGFKEDMTIGAAYGLIFSFLHELVAAIAEYSE